MGKGIRVVSLGPPEGLGEQMSKELAERLREYADGMLSRYGSTGMMLREAADALDPPKPEGPPKDGAPILARWSGGVWLLVQWQGGFWYTGDTRYGQVDPDEWLPFTDPTVHEGEPPQSVKDSGEWVEVECGLPSGTIYHYVTRWIDGRWLDEVGTQILNGVTIIRWRRWSPMKGGTP